MPLRAAASAVTCAANGVDLREPLKPAPPADSHAITLPSLSVSATIVLLKLVLMCAWPKGTFLRTRLRPRGLRGWGIYLLTSVLANLLLAAAGRGAALRSLPGARVGLRPLPVRRQAAPVAQALVRPDLHQPLDVLRALAPQVALHEQVVDLLAQLADLVLGQVLHLAVRLHARLGQDLVRGRPADAVDVREPDLSPLVEGDVDACYACHLAPSHP